MSNTDCKCLEAWKIFGNGHLEGLTSMGNPMLQITTLWLHQTALECLRAVKYWNAWIYNWHILKVLEDVGGFAMCAKIAVKLFGAATQ